MRQLIVMTIPCGAEWTPIEMLYKFGYADPKIKEIAQHKGGTIIYPDYVYCHEGLFDHDNCKWMTCPGIPYGVIGDIFKYYGSSEYETIVYPGYGYAREHKVAFIRPETDHIEETGDRDCLFKFDSMQTYPEYGIAVMKFTSLYDRINARKDAQLDVEK